jgi:GWxTD domain-containing protein
MRKLTLVIMISILALILLFTSCVTSKMEKRLDPLSGDFFGKVRYIITNEESKMFLELPPSARDEFIESFWARRDPTPNTEFNEYRETYYDRIDESNRLFKGGGRPGWLQERGRIYILFGPPDERITNPMGGQPIDPYADPRDMIDGERRAQGEKPTEVWVYYNLFSVMQQPHVIKLTFVDSYGTGDYKLTTNINEVIPGRMGAQTEFAPDLVFTHELYKEEQIQSERYIKKTLFDFSWELLRKKDRELGSNLQINIVIPHKKIIFLKEADRLRAEIRINIQVKDATGELIWQIEDEYPLNFDEKFLEKNTEGTFAVSIPVGKWLNKGNYSVHILALNISGDQEIKKLLPLKM